MEIKDMTLADVDARLAELEMEVREATDVEEIDKRTEEVKLLNERRAELKDLEERKAQALELTAEPTKANIIEERKETEKMADLMEIRKTDEYSKAYFEMVKTGNDKEVRMLLSDAVEGGSVPTPVTLANEIKNAWEESKLMALVSKSSIPGDYKVAFEVSATGAAIHVEGTDAPAEQQLVLGTVNLSTQAIKKWITVSDIAIENTTIDTLNYLYREIAHKIVEKAEEVLLGIIIASPAVSSTTAPAVPVSTVSALAVETITMALAELSGQAKNVTLVMNRRTYAALIAEAKKNKYGVDPFDGCPVVYTDGLKSFASASSGDTVIIAGDFGYGAHANFPAGNDVKIRVDEDSLAEKDLVKVVGKQLVGMGVVAPNAFVKVNKQ